MGSLHKQTLQGMQDRAGFGKGEERNINRKPEEPVKNHNALFPGLEKGQQVAFQPEGEKEHETEIEGIDEGIEETAASVFYRFGTTPVSAQFGCTEISLNIPVDLLWHRHNIKH